MSGEELALEGNLPEEAPTAKPQQAPTDWWAEARGIVWLVLAVLGFHSFIAKPFYIPSESMLPGLQVGDRLVVTKYPFGYSYVSPTFHLLPHFGGRLFGRMPVRGDVVIASPPGKSEDYIKRVIGLPGDTVEVRDGVLILNGAAVKRGPLHYVTIRDYGGYPGPDQKMTCDIGIDRAQTQLARADGRMDCRLPVITETLPNGRSYDTVDSNPASDGDNFGPVTVPEGHVFLMGDNRDNSADSRFPVDQQGLGGPVPWENLGGRAEFVTFSVDGTASWNPLTWWGALRGDRAGATLHAKRDQ